jgi:hypothetical protein
VAVFVMMEMVSRFCVCICCKSLTAVETAQHLLFIFGIFGVPESLELKFDGGFVNEITDELIDILDGTKIIGCPHSHEDQGMVEREIEEFWRFARGLIYAIPTRLKQWYLLVPTVNRILNNHPYGPVGIPPAELMLPFLDTKAHFCGEGDIRVNIEEGGDILADMLRASDVLLQYAETELNKLRLEKERKAARGERDHLQIGSYILLGPTREERRMRTDKHRFTLRGPFKVQGQVGPTVAVESIIDGSVLQVDITRIYPCHMDLRFTDPKEEAAKDSSTVRIERVVNITGDLSKGRSALHVEVKYWGRGPEFNESKPWDEVKTLAEINIFILSSDANFDKWNKLLTKELRKEYKQQRKEREAQEKQQRQLERDLKAQEAAEKLRHDRVLRADSERTNTRGAGAADAEAGATVSEEVSPITQGEEHQDLREGAAASLAPEKPAGRGARNKTQVQKPGSIMLDWKDLRRQRKMKNVFRLIRRGVEEQLRELTEVQRHPKKGDIMVWRRETPQLEDGVDGEKLGVMDEQMLKEDSQSYLKANIWEGTTSETRKKVEKLLFDFRHLGEPRKAPSKFPPLQLRVKKGCENIYPWAKQRSHGQRELRHLKKFMELFQKYGIVEQIGKRLDGSDTGIPDSPYNSCIWMHDEGLDADGNEKFRFLQDGAPINKILEALVSEFPDIRMLYERFKGFTNMGKLDFTKFFFQFLVDEDSRKFSAFTLPDGTRWQFCRMVMGNLNSPPWCQRQVNKVFGPNSIWMDDLGHGGIGDEAALEDMERVLRICSDHNIQISFPKLWFGYPKIDFVGREMSGTGYRLSEAHRVEIMAWEPPTYQKKMQSLLGLCNYARIFVQDYASLVGDLQKGIEGNDPPVKARYDWTVPGRKEAFDRLKQAVCESEMLYHIDWTKRFFIEVDASDDGWGAILYQYEGEEPADPGALRDPDAKICIVGIISGRFTSTQRRWMTPDQELFAVWKACETWRPLINGREFTCYTDHRNLTFGLKSTERKVIRWIFSLKDLDALMVHCPGKRNIYGDTLSRMCRADSYDW